MTEVVCEGRYCPCRSHLNPDMPGWVLDAYMPSRWALETMHQIYLDRRTADQVTVFIGELGNLTDMAYDPAVPFGVGVARSRARRSPQEKALPFNPTTYDDLEAK